MWNRSEDMEGAAGNEPREMRKGVTKKYNGNENEREETDGEDWQWYVEL